MMQLVIGSVLLGAVFGLRFKVMALMPLTVIGWAAIGMIGFGFGETGAAVAMSLLAFALALQVGYVFGSMTRMTMAALRAQRIATARASVSNAR